MPDIAFVLPSGERRVVAIPVGESFMRGAKAHGIDEIVAECGGSLACASCHVMVPERYASLFPPPSESEEQMLDFVMAGRVHSSRLSCQLIVTQDMHGMEVTVASPQV